MGPQLIKFAKHLLIFSAGFYLLHLLVERWLIPPLSSYYPLWTIYVFLGLLTLAGHMLVLWINGRMQERTAAAFIAIGFFKMLGAIVFLYPLIASGSKAMVAQILVFFIPYFLFLGFDTYYTVRLLRQNP
jgi:hypothetical protein